MNYDYDSLGRIAAKTVYYGYGADDKIVYCYQYDLLDRVLQERTEDALGNVIEQIDKIYDVEGRVILESSYNENGANTVETRYDSCGTPVEVIDALGNSTKTIVYYDYRIGEQFVPCSETIDALGNSTILIKDALGQDSMLIRKNAFGEITQQRTFHYDLSGNLEKVIETVFGNESYDVVMVRSYNQMNQVKTVIEAFESPEQRITNYSYNHRGQLQSIQKPSGVSILHEYTEEGLLSRYLASDASFHYTYEYDLNHNLTLSRDELRNSTTIRSYSQDRLIEEKQASGFIVKYEYDRMGRITRFILPDSSSIQYTYANIHLKGISRCNSQNEIAYEHTFDKFDISGNSLSQTLIGKAGSLRNIYDRKNRLISRISRQTSEKNIFYDLAGNLVSRDLEDSRVTTHCRYAYDDLYQLKSEEGIISHEYAFDSIYNRIAQDGGEIQYNFLNQRQAAGFQYDEDGRLTNTPTSAYTYDALDRLISVTKDGVTTEYAYDSFNRRLSKSDTFFLYDGQKEIGAYSNSRLVEFRTLAPAESEIGSVIAVEIQNVPYAPVHDISGSVCALISLDGNLAESYRYTAFGEEVSHSALNPWRFASKRYDPESGLIYFGNRYYDPSLGCWITPDPIGHSDGPNLYAYVSNNPLTHFDAYGLFEEETQPSNDNSSVNEVQVRDDDARTSPLDHIKDFGTGVVSGFWDPISTGHDLYSGNYQDKSIGRMAGETMGMLANFNPAGIVKSSVRQATKMSLPIALKAFNWVRGAANVRVMKNMVHVGKVAAANEKIIELSKSVQGIAIQTETLKCIRYLNKNKLSQSLNYSTLAHQEYTYSKSAARHLTERASTSRNYGKLERPFMQSPLTIDSIISTGKGVQDLHLKQATKFSVPGRFRSRDGEWELVVDLKTKIIYHFNFNGK